jgi:threonine/homoserine efflux transporter RhtA
MSDNSITISVGQTLARELYELARAPRIVDIRLSNEARTELLTMLKPVVDKDDQKKDAA